MGPRIRDASAGDWSDIWQIVREVVVAGDTFAYAPETTEDDARELWMVGQPDDDRGQRRCGAWHGKHVREPCRAWCARRECKLHGRVGRAGPRRGTRLVEDTQTWARAAGFRSMQFNAVAETNAAAVGPYGSVGFTIAGRFPRRSNTPSMVSSAPCHVQHKFTNNGPGPSKLICIHFSPTFIGEWLE